jgi:RNA polymerase sigma factor (sigma-70 family)
MIEATQDAWDRVEAHLDRVLPLAWEYRHLGVPLEDLEAEGTLGLLEAATRFDPARGVRFLTYAGWWIRKRIVEAISRQSLLVRLPRGAVDRLRRVRRAEQDLTAQLGRAPTCEEIGRASGLPARDVDFILLSARREVSLEEPVGRDGSRLLEEVLPDLRTLGPEDALARATGKSHVRALLGRLPARARAVLVLRFGFVGDADLSLSDVGALLGVTRERARQLERKGLELLRAQCTGSSGARLARGSAVRVRSR